MDVADNEALVDLIEVNEIRVERAVDGGVDVFRVFTADVMRVDTRDSEVIGDISGWIGWNMAKEDVFDCADAVSMDAATLGWVAAEIIPWCARTAHVAVRDLIFIDTIRLDPTFRGNRVSGAIVDQLLGLLRIRSERTLVELIPEPQDEDGDELEPGAAHDAAARKVQNAFEACGFQRWPESGVWWRLGVDGPPAGRPVGDQGIPPEVSSTPPTLRKLRRRP